MIRAQTFKATNPARKNLTSYDHSQGGVAGSDINKRKAGNFALIGAGGLGSWVFEGLLRLGAGHVSVFDDDTIDYSNLSRQNFDWRDIGKNKAVYACKRLRKIGLFGTTLHAYPHRLEDAAKEGHDFTQYDVLAVLVDNSPARRLGCELGLQHDIPVVQAGISGSANNFYVATQKTGEACWACMFPNAVDDKTYPCAPGIADVCFVAAGTILFAIDSLICGRHREWNLRAISMDGTMPDTQAMMARKADCALCGKQAETK